MPVSTSKQPGTASAVARARFESAKGEPLLLSDWNRALFIHFRVDAAALQREVPFRLDLHHGEAYVSLVAFTMRRLRPRRGGQLTEWFFKPIATHPLLNLRTYVRHCGESGIYFLAEWIPNRLSAFLGPRTFGLPYRVGRLDYRHVPEKGCLTGRVQSLNARAKAGLISDSTEQHPNAPLEFAYRAECIQEPVHENQSALSFRPCAAHSLDEFLLERYVAFTQYNAKRRFFQVWHSAWPQRPVRIKVLADSLLRGATPFLSTAELIGGNYSPGVEKVWMGRPRNAQVAFHRHSV
jgi:uncharacterized protein YqjF (DUF2071 family)